MATTESSTTNVRRRKATPTSSDDKKDVADDAWLATLGSLRRSAKRRQMSASQRDALLMAVGLRVNLLMRGPPGTGKRWITRHMASTAELLGEHVEIMAKFFNVLPNGQLVVDAAAFPVAWTQLQRASVLIIEDVPSQSQSSAASFFAYLDLLCRLARCRTAPIISNAINTKTSEFSSSSSATSTASKPWRRDADVSTEDAPEQLSFGGVQILATQNISPTGGTEMSPTPDVTWHHVTGNIGVMNTSHLPAPPHDNIKIIVFQ